MTAGSRRAAGLAALAALLLCGAVLRLHRWREAPPGPWIDEALGLRAARLAAATGAPLVGTSPLQPPDAGFVNYWLTNPALHAISLVDRAAGGGIASVRAMSLLPALVLLLAIAGAAREAARGRAFPALAAVLLAATSSWLLVAGRWGWISTATSALAVLSAWAALRAARSGSLAAAGASGALLGLACWGYVAAWAAVPLPFLVLAAAHLGHRRLGTGESRRARAAALAGLAAFLLVAVPLALHLARHPERAVARTRELSAGRAGGPGLLPGLTRNALAYARLFATGGDPNERHGDPSRPVLPPAVTGLALVGAATAVRRPDARLLAGAAALFLLASLLAVEEAANAFRAVHAAPFLLLLAALGAERLVELLPQGRRAAGGALLALLLAVSALVDATGFLGWLSSPRLYGAFGGPERDLADAVAAERARGGPAELLLTPGGARNAFVVDALLQPPGSAAPALRQVSALAAFRHDPPGDVLFADAASDAAGPAALGARRVAAGGALPGRPGWALWRLPAAEARRVARAHLDRFPRVEASGTGALDVREEGLYTFSSRGGVEVRLDGGVVFDASRPAGSLTARLAPGRHRLAVRTVADGGVLRMTGPDGFVLPFP